MSVVFFCRHGLFRGISSVNLQRTLQISLPAYIYKPPLSAAYHYLHKNSTVKSRKLSNFSCKDVSKNVEKSLKQLTPCWVSIAVIPHNLQHQLITVLSSKLMQLKEYATYTHDCLTPNQSAEAESHQKKHPIPDVAKPNL